MEIEDIICDYKVTDDNSYKKFTRLTTFLFSSYQVL